MTAPPTTAFRGRVRALLEREAASAAPRDVVVLAVDGIRFDLAGDAWPHARIEKLRAVFPTSSSTGWLSSLSGVDVDAHGVPGVVFRVGNGAAINVFEFHGELGGAATENVFGDAAALGFEPLAVGGDLDAYPCAWLDLLLRGARRLGGYRFWATDGFREPREICADVRRAVAEARVAGRRRPVFVWCFTEPDRHVHRFGYDAAVVRFLELVGELATDLAGDGAVVLAHADHGLTPTAHDERLGRTVDRLRARYGFEAGGAGRARWLYPRDGDGELREALARELPDSVRVLDADSLFAPGSLARSRVGDIVLLAEGDSFLTSPGYAFDHGSLTAAEVDVPIAEWRA
jgi:hypothetical protein